VSASSSPRWLRLLLERGRSKGGLRTRLQCWLLRWCGWNAGTDVCLGQAVIIDGTNLVTNPAGNRPQNPSLVIGIAIHHTVGNNAVQSESAERNTIRIIDQQHFNQGFGGFGYHGIVFPSGRVYHCGEGQRAHVAGRNHQLRGWVFSGTFTHELPTPAAYEGMREALLWERATKPLTVMGHREWALMGEGTACPGMIVPFDWELFLANPQKVVAGVGAHFTDGTDMEIWNNTSGKVLDGIGIRYDNGEIEGVWP
jgi:hypothetical protein